MFSTWVTAGACGYWKAVHGFWAGAIGFFCTFFSAFAAAPLGEYITPTLGLVRRRGSNGCPATPDPMRGPPRPRRAGPLIAR